MSDIQAKAWTYTSTKGGLIKNLRLTDYKIPHFKKDHVLIEVLSVSLNPGDYKFPDVPIVSWLIRRPASPCFDFCGRIRAIPQKSMSDTRNLHVGQTVFGMHRDLKSLGTLKTLMWVHKDSCYPLPENVPVEHGSALGVGAMTAYQAIAPHAKPNKKVLINGGTGGVGTFCIQVAKALDMHVIATCSEAGVQLCKDLGADEILNYKSPTFLDDLRRTTVDLVVDNVGSDPQLHRLSEAFLEPDGHFVLVALMDNDWAGIQSMLVSWFCPVWLGGPSRKWRVVFTQSKISDYEPVAAMAKEGKIEVVVDTLFSFKDVPKAFERLKSGRAKGKVLIDVRGHDQ
jgi:NADPH:quinone reductase-like Zn-dependent oxidoreductase